MIICFIKKKERVFYYVVGIFNAIYFEEKLRSSKRKTRYDTLRSRRRSRSRKQRRIRMSLSPEIQKLHDEIRELKLRTYQQKLEQKKKKLLEEINNNNDNEEENETKNEHDDECEVAGDLATFDEREAEKKEIYKYMLGAILSYTLLMLYMFSTFFIIHKLRQYGCNLVEDGFMKLKKNLETSGGDYNNMTDAEKTEFITAQVEGQLNECQYYLKHSFDKNSAIVTLHNLTFGLVSAVVVSQIGSHQQQQQSQQKNRSINKLTNRMLHTTKSASESRIVLRVVYEFITWTPRIYVLTWILTGCACLLCGTIWGAEYSGPLYVNGQAWLGIAITTVYLFFGVQETAKENNDTKKEKDSVVDEHNDDADDSDDDNIDADCNKHNDKNEEFERDLIVGNSSSLSGNTVTSSAFIQTATSRSRFVEEKDDNDEEEGTLYPIDL